MEKKERTTPADYNLPNHTDFRPHQRETIEKLLAKNPGSITVLQAPVGSGKTSLAKAMSITERGVTSLVKTKLLQQSNYGETYSFDVLYGKSNYSCPHPDQPNADSTAAECLFEGDMPSCDIAHECPFLQQKDKVIASKARSLNYSLFLMSRWCKIPKFTTDYLVIDEAHLLSDEVVEFVGCTVRDVDRIRNGLPAFPAVYQSSSDGIDKISSWLDESIEILDARADAADKEKKSKIERLNAKLFVTLSSIQSNKSDWYARAGDRATEFNGQQRPGLVIKPLTAKYHFSKLFLGKYSKTVLMSATIGNIETFTSELGIKSYEFDAIPNQFPPERRPVHIPACPVLGYKSPPAHWDEQARIIKKQICDLPPEWLGVLHTNSFKQASDLAGRLGKQGFDTSRLFIPQSGGGTNKQMNDWNEFKRRKTGAIIITPSFAEGVDLGEERICIIAKTPFGSVSPGSFEAERMAYSSSGYKQRTAYKTMQMSGRTRRGRDGDYDTSHSINGWVSIVDGAFVKQGIRSYCDKDFIDSLIYE